MTTTDTQMMLLDMLTEAVGFFDAHTSVALEAVRKYADMIVEHERRCVELPTDADDEPIHVGDRLDYNYGLDLRGTRTVTALILSDRWDFEFDHEEDTRDVADMSDFKRCNRHHRKTVDELLREFYAAYDSAVSSTYDKTNPMSVVDEYAAMLRLSEDAS